MKRSFVNNLLLVIMPGVSRKKSASRKNFAPGGGCQQGADGRFGARKKPCLAGHEEALPGLDAYYLEGSRQPSSGDYVAEEVHFYNLSAKGLPHTFATISVLSVKRMFNHCLRYMSGYRSDLTGFQLEYAVKKYKGHRAVPSSHNKLTANELAKWLIKPSMVLKKLQ